MSCYSNLTSLFESIVVVVGQLIESVLNSRYNHFTSSPRLYI